MLSRFLTCFALFYFLLTAAPAPAVVFKGLVTDAGGHPVDGARVRLQGTDRTTLTDGRGLFFLEADEKTPAKRITAWQTGYYNGGTPLRPGNVFHRIELKPVPGNDNRAYQWLISKGTAPSSAKGPAEAKPCQDCHPGIAAEWTRDAHSRAAINPVFLAFYNGTGQGGQEAGPGYKLDFPHSKGNCCTCHLPILALSNPFDADPNQARGPALEGVSCDFCHKIKDVGLDRTGGYPGVLSIKLNRPEDGHQVFYGPYDDVFPGEDSYHPLYRDSRYCAPCHQGKFWDVLIYSEFEEWASSSYAKDGVHCQACHMKPGGSMDRFALEKEGGLLRDPRSIPSHVNFGVKDADFMKESVNLEAAAELNGDILTVSIKVENTGAGHHYPTGNPMRNLILLVKALDGRGRPLPMIQGERVPDWGGEGPEEEGNYAGLPGKGFAKILSDRTIYPDRRRKRDFVYEYPAPHWRPTRIESDNRIPANRADQSVYRFRAPRDSDSKIRVLTTLLFRRTFINWNKAKNLGISDLEVGFRELLLRR